MNKQQKIPEGWKQTVLYECLRQKPDYGINASAVEYSENLPTYLRITDISEEGLFLDSGKKSIKDPKAKQYFLRKGDIVLARTGASVGKSYYYNGDDGELVFAGFLIRVSTDETKLDSKFLFNYLKTENYSKWIKVTSSRSGQPGVNGAEYSKMPIMIPQISEQKRIVQILESWNKYLRLLEQKIKSKKKIENFAKIGLLTGKNYPNSELFEKEKRFFKVPSHWQVVPISSVAKEVSIKNKDGKELPVLSCTKYNGLVDSLKFFKKQIFSKDLSTYKIVSRNEFAYATNHIEEGSIGLQKTYDRALVSPMYTVFKTSEDILSEYLFPLLKTELYRCKFEAATSSSVNRRGSLRWKAFSKIKIPLPPIEEQRKIVSMLQVVRQEIEALEKQYQLMTEQKNYLLNNLITGQIRVPEFASHN